MSGPAWARGHDVERLKALARPFAEHCRPYVNGAFGLPKEADVAAALEADECSWACSGKAISATALFRVLKSGSTHRDFAGRQVKLQAGDLSVRTIGGTEEGRARIVDSLVERSGAPAIWLEDWIESPLSGQWGRMGFGLAGVKVAASSDIKGLWHLGDPDGRLPGELEPAQVPALAILAPEWASAAERAAILAEIGHHAQTADPWAQHYSSYNKRQSWTAFALRGFDAADPGFIIKPAEMSKAWRAEHPERMGAACADTLAMASFPAAMALVDRIPAEKQRIRFMRLSAAGGELTRHADIVDPEAGVLDGQTVRLHIPILSPPECEFSAWQLDGQRRDLHLPEGSLAYLDTRKPHAVRNPGGRDRVHLVVDAFANDRLRAMIEAA